MLWLTNKYLWLSVALVGALGLSYHFGATSVQSDWNAEKAATVTAMIRMNTERAEREKLLTVSELKAWEQYQNAQIESDRLNSELESRPWRVRIYCPAGNQQAASVGDGKTAEYAELPDSVARSITAIGRDADRCEAKLKALQDFITIELGR